MAYLKEAQVREAAQRESRILAKSTDAAGLLKESVEGVSSSATFDIFLCHSIRDAEIVLGTKRLLEQRGQKVYVDWIVDPKMDRSLVTSATAAILRNRMNQSRSLFYLYSENSQRSRWMPWELGYFDGKKGAVAVLPIEPDGRAIDFTKEEFLGLYPKAEIVTSTLFINRTKTQPVTAAEKDNYRSFSDWLLNPESLRP